jgi:hypothetical protein
MAKIDDDIAAKLIGADTKPESNITIEDIKELGGEQALLEAEASIDSYNLMLEQKITFITPNLTKFMPLTRENLYLMCASSGAGKSTAAANISYSLWKEQKKVLIIANEESQSDILFRIGCLELGLNFNDFKKNKMDIEDQLRVRQLLKSIAEYVKIMDVTYKDGLTSNVDGVTKAMEAVKNHDFSCVLIDYFQNISNTNVVNDTRILYQRLDDFRSYLKTYIKSANVPVVLFAQLHPSVKRGKDLEARIKDCPKIFEAATVAFEIVPNYEELKTDFLVWKSRFGGQGKKVTLYFANGRLCDESSAQAWIESASEKADEVESLLGGMDK